MTAHIVCEPRDGNRLDDISRAHHKKESHVLDTVCHLCLKEQYHVSSDKCISTLVINTRTVSKRVFWYLRSSPPLRLDGHVINNLRIVWTFGYLATAFEKGD